MFPYGEMTDRERMFAADSYDAQMYGTAAEGAAREQAAQKLAMDIERAKQARIMRETALAKVQPTMPPQPLMQREDLRGKVPGMQAPVAANVYQKIPERSNTGRMAASSTPWKRVDPPPTGSTWAVEPPTQVAAKGNYHFDNSIGIDVQKYNQGEGYVGSNGFTDNFGSFGPKAGPNIADVIRGGMYG